MKFSGVFTGTAKQFEDCGVKVNGKFVSAIGVSVLAEHGFIEKAGFGAKPARGRQPTLFRAVNREGFTVEFMEHPKSVEEITKEREQSKALAATVAALQKANETNPGLSVADVTLSDVLADSVMVSDSTETATIVDVSNGQVSETTETETQASAEEQGPF